MRLRGKMPPPPSGDSMLASAIKAVQLFERRDRLQLAGMLAAVLLMAALETVGIASIMPFMALVANPNAIEKHRLLRQVYVMFKFENQTHFLIFVGIGSMVAMIISNAATAVTSWLISKVSWNQNYTLSTRLLARYLAQPYISYLNRNTASLAKNILNEVTTVTNGVLLPLMQVIARVLVTLCIVALLVAVDGRLAFYVAAALGGAYLIIYLSVRQRQRRMGIIRLQATTDRFKTANEALSGIKDVRMLGREAHFVRRFRGPSKRYSDAMAMNAVVGTFPRYAMETVAFGGILLILIYRLAAHEDLSQVLPIVGLYALAGYRLMPALQQILKGMVSVRFNIGSLDELHAALRDREGSDLLKARAYEANDQPDIPFEHVIELANVTFTYPGAHRPAVCDVKVSIPRLTRTAFVGATGAGKSTLVDILLGLLPLEQGAIVVDGLRIEEGNVRAWRRHVGYVPQHIFLCDDTITRNIAFGMPDKEIDVEAVERAARIANLHDFVATLPAGYGTVIGERGVRLSGGQRQRIGIARAVYHNPDVIVFDEATSALDGITESAVMEAIEGLAISKTVVIIAHRLSSVRSCDVIYLMDKGAIVAAGTYDELIETNVAFRAMAGV